MGIGETLVILKGKTKEFEIESWGMANILVRKCDEISTSKSADMEKNELGLFIPAKAKREINKENYFEIVEVAVENSHAAFRAGTKLLVDNHDLDEVSFSFDGETCSLFLLPTRSIIAIIKEKTNERT